MWNWRWAKFKNPVIPRTRNSVVFFLRAFLIWNSVFSKKVYFLFVILSFGVTCCLFKRIMRKQSNVCYISTISELPIYVTNHRATSPETKTAHFRLQVQFIALVITTFAENISYILRYFTTSSPLYLVRIPHEVRSIYIYLHIHRKNRCTYMAIFYTCDCKHCVVLNFVIYF